MKAGTKPAEFACLPARHTDNHSVQRQLDALAGVHRNESAGGVPVAAIGLFRYQMTVSLIIGELLMIHATVVAIMVLALGVTARPLPAFAANGDLVQQTNFAQACGSGIGVGIAFDGKKPVVQLLRLQSGPVQG